MNTMSYEKARELFDYRSDGQLLWRVNSGGRKVKGKVVGCINGQGYIQTRIKGKSFMVHRLVWLWHHGYLPENDMDHIDRDRSNNRIANLREASRQCNLRNSGNRKDNTSGVKGVHWGSHNRKWVAAIMHDGKISHLGYFADFTEAVLTRLAAEQCFEWPKCDSATPAYLYAMENKLLRKRR